MPVVEWVLQGQQHVLSHHQVVRLLRVFWFGGGPVDCLCVFFIAALLLFSGFVRLQRVCESEL